jgi:pantetheine-phosphate adenylyltransferase
LSRKIAIYPGSFDPPTKGHLDLIARGSRIFDELVVAILRNPHKTPLFSVDERKEMIELLTSGYKNVRVDTFEGLTVDYATRLRATAVLRGIRAISDYEYELQMALMNRKLQPGLETVFMMPAEHYSYISSRLVREIAEMGGPVGALVPGLIEQRLRAKFKTVTKRSRSKATAPQGRRGKKRTTKS